MGIFAEEHHARPQGREAQVVAVAVRKRHQPGLHAQYAEEVHAEDAQALLTPRQARLDLQHRARRGHLRPARQGDEEALVEAVARSHHLQVGLARDRAHAAAELVERGAVDQVHRQPERDAERDRQQRQRAGQAAAQQAGEEESAQRHAHRARPLALHGRPARAAGNGTAARLAGAIMCAP